MAGATSERARTGLREMPSNAARLLSQVRQPANAVIDPARWETPSMWKRSGSDEPRESAAAMCEPSLAERIERQGAADRSRLLAPYKQEVARSSRAPPIAAKGASER